MEVLPVIPKRFKFARGVTWLFFSLSILLLVYTYYRAEVIFQGNQAEKYFNYYVIFLSGSLFWGMVLRLKDKIKLNIAMVITSLVVGIYLAEITLNFVDPSVWNKFGEGPEFDKRTQHQVYMDLKNEGIDAVPLMSPYFLDLQKIGEGVESLIHLGGVSGRTTIGSNESGKFMIFFSDRYGFNNPDSEWDLPQTEWLLVGDSFAQGQSVQPGEDIAGQIRLITGENTLTLGMSGNGPLAELATLKEYAEPQKPKTVLWLYYEGNDMVNLEKEKSSPLFMSYLQPEFSQNLIHKQTEIDNMLDTFIREASKKQIGKTDGRFIQLETPNRDEFLWRIRMLRLSNIRKRIGFDSFRQTEIVVRPLFSEILTKARDQVAAWGGKLHFIYLPARGRYERGVQDHDLYKKSEVIGVAKDLNLPVIDIHQKVFANHPDPLDLFYFRASSHYTAEGYSEVAKAIVSEVTGVMSDN